MELNPHIFSVNFQFESKARNPLPPDVQILLICHSKKIALLLGTMSPVRVIEN